MTADCVSVMESQIVLVISLVAHQLSAKKAQVASMSLLNRQLLRNQIKGTVCTAAKTIFPRTRGFSHSIFTSRVQRRAEFYLYHR